MFSSFVEQINIPSGCGGDVAEDISSGLKIVTEMLSWDHGTKARDIHRGRLIKRACVYPS